jgi:RNA polymerase sigma-70 factor (ECF subfamily)
VARTTPTAGQNPLWRLGANHRRQYPRNLLRSRSRRIRAETLDDGFGEPIDQAADFRSEVHMRMHLDELFELLPIDQRLVLGLCYGADLSIAETARTLGIPVGTAKSRLNAGLKRLRQSMAGQGRTFP